MRRAGRRALLVMAAAAGFTAAALWIPAFDSLVVRTRSGRIAAILPLPREEPTFVISWRHSVTREPCAEFFRRGEGGGIELYRTVFKGLGAGLPFGEEEGDVTLRDGAIVIEGMKRTVPRLTLAVLPLTEHRLEVGSRAFAVLDLLGGEHFGIFTIEKKPLGQIALARVGSR